MRAFLFVMCGVIIGLAIAVIVVKVAQREDV